MLVLFFFFNDTATTEIYTLSLHDALPILRDELGVTSVVVSHDVRGSFRVADRVALLWQAKIRAVGPPDQILASKDPAVLQFLERDLEMTLIQAEGVARGRNV